MCVYCVEESNPKSSAPNPATSSTLKIDSAPQPSTPVSVPSLAKLLHSHPNTIFTNYVLSGMQHGFPIGHTVPLTREISSENHPSASRNMQFVSDHLASCCLDGQTWGPFHTPPFPHVQVSGLGVVPKKNGKFWVIHDLSSPPPPTHGNSVNDAIPPSVFSLQYESLDTAINATMKLGRGSYLTKNDIRNPNL